jgi:hypothetical protein
MHRSNALIAFAATANSPVALPMIDTVTVTDSSIPVMSSDQVRARLAEEVTKIIAAGHLRPGYMPNGITGYQLNQYTNADNLGDYWSNPADTLLVLSRAMPYLSTDLQNQLKTYLHSEFGAYPPYSYTHIGWSGASREVYDLPPEAQSWMASISPSYGNMHYAGWYFAPYSFYAMWKYAQIFPSDAKTIFDTSKSMLESPPADSYLTAYPQVLNSYIAGYKGYLELQKLAGYATTTTIQSTYNRLLALRVSSFTKDGPTQPATPYNSPVYIRSLNVSRNFLYLVPELGQYLHDNALSKVQQAFTEYNQVAPYWFVSKFGAVYGEGVTEHLYDYHAMFQAKALILQDSRQELAQYLDEPGVAVGDLFYIDNLISTIEAEGR